LQAATTRILISCHTTAESFVLLHLPDSWSSREKQVLFQPLILTLSELLTLPSSHRSHILTKIPPRKGSEDQLTLGYWVMKKYDKSTALGCSSAKKIQLF